MKFNENEKEAGRLRKLLDESGCTSREHVFDYDALRSIPEVLEFLEDNIRCWAWMVPKHEQEALNAGTDQDRYDRYAAMKMLAFQMWLAMCDTMEDEVKSEAMLRNFHTYLQKVSGASGNN